MAWWNPNTLPALKGGSRRKKRQGKGQSMEQAKKKKITAFRFVFHFLAPELHSEKQKNWKRKEKKTAYFDKSAIFTLGSLVKLLLLPTAYVENPEGWHKITWLTVPRYYSGAVVTRILYSPCSSFHIKYREHGQATESGEIISMKYYYQSIKWFKKQPQK